MNEWGLRKFIPLTLFFNPPAYKNPRGKINCDLFEAQFNPQIPQPPIDRS
jgi:hypothetical protein